jgi:hypothetical protein
MGQAEKHELALKNNNFPPDNDQHARGKNKALSFSPPRAPLWSNGWEFSGISGG